MRSCTLLLFFALMGSPAWGSDLLAVLDTPETTVRQGKAVRLVFSVRNVSRRELLMLGAGNDMFDEDENRFFMIGSGGERIPPGISIDAARLSQEELQKYYRLVKPGESLRVTWALTDRYVFSGEAGSSDNPDCYQVEPCMQIGRLTAPADTYRLKWLHTSEKVNPFTAPDDRAKVWIGEVWSNTLIIQTTEKEPVKVGLDVDPDTLNFKSEGKWITAYLSAPQDADLIAQTTKFQGSIVADKVEWDQGSGAGGQWMIKFPRSLAIDLLREIRGWELDPSADGRGGMMKVFVSAESGEKMFWGDDEVRILEDPGNAPPSPPSGSKPSTPPGQDKKKSPRR